MKIRTIALAGVAAAALCSPALASEPGWYLSLGAGFDSLQPVHMQFPPPPVGGFNFNTDYSPSALVIGGAGYKFDSGMRVELELGYTQHDATFGSVGGVHFSP